MKLGDRYNRSDASRPISRGHEAVRGACGGCHKSDLLARVAACKPPGIEICRHFYTWLTGRQRLRVQDWVCRADSLTQKESALLVASRKKSLGAQLRWEGQADLAIRSNTLSVIKIMSQPRLAA